MKKHFVTDALLRKYHAGRCSDEEKTMVEEWLASADDNSEPIHTPLEESLIQERMWWVVQSDMDRSRSRRTMMRRRFSYAAAAAVTVMMITWAGFFAFKGGSERTLVLQLSNTGSQVAFSSTNDLSVTTLPQTNVAMVMGGELLHTRIDFCDVVLLKNEGEEDMKLMFKANCAEDMSLPLNHVVKRGETYVVYRYKQIELSGEGQQQIVVIPRDQIASNILPKYAQLNLLKRLKEHNI